MKRITEEGTTKVVKTVNGYEIEKSYELTVNAFDEVKGRKPFYSCVFDDAICETFDTLKSAVDYCKAH